MIDNSIKITEDLLSVSECPTSNKSLISGSKKSKFIDQTLKSEKIECKNGVVNETHNSNRKESFLFKQTSSYNCSDEENESEVNELCSNIEESDVFLETKFCSASKKQNTINDEINPIVEAATNLKVDKEKVRKVSEQIATFELLNLEETDYQKYKEKSKPKQTRKINSKTLYNSHKHNLSYKTIRENTNNNCEITEEVFPENTKNNSCLSPRLRNRLSTSPTKMRAHMSQHLSNFELLKLQAEKLNKSNILINTPGYSKCRPNSGQKEEEKAKYYHNYIFHNNELPCQNRNMNRKISHETISSNHKTSNKTMQTFHQNKSITNRKEPNVLKTEGDEIIQPRLSYKHKKNNSNMMFSKTKNQTGYANLLIGNEKNCNKSCSEFYNNRDESENIKIELEEQEKVGLTNEQYLISNEFVPFVSRSIWDKNRKNIKKINGGVTKILNIKNKFNRTLKESIKEGIKTNENINKFIKNKLNLLENNHNSDSSEKEHTHKRIPTSTSFYDNKELTIGFQKNDNVLKETNNNKPNHHETSKSAPKTFNQSKNITAKVSNAEKFYKAQQEKHQAKSQLLVVDPLLKTKAIEMGSKQQKKNNDIVIICF